MTSVKIGTKRLTGDLLAGLGLRGLGAASSFAFAWMIAQVFGARVVGLYQIGYTTAILLATIAVLSMDVLLVRKTTPLVAKNDLAAASGVFARIRRLVFTFGTSLMFVGAVAAIPFATHIMDEPDLGPFIVLLAPVVLLLPLIRVQNALLRSLGKVWVPQSLEGVSYVTIAIIGLATLWLTLTDPPALSAPVLLVIGMSASAWIGHVVTRRHVKAWPAPGETEPVDLRAGVAIAAAPIINQAGQWLILLAIAAMMSAADAGIFRIAVLTCMLMELVNTSFATMAGPYLARAAAAGDKGQIRRTILIAGSVGAVIASPVALAALFFPEWVLALFGEEFVAGALALQVLGVSQLINVLAGPVGIALIMQGRERWVLVVEAVATACGLATALSLIGNWGLAGAAVGMLVAALIRNLVNWLLVQLSDPVASTA